MPKEKGQITSNPYKNDLSNVKIAEKECHKKMKIEVREKKKKIETIDAARNKQVKAGRAKEYRTGTSWKGKRTQSCNKKEYGS